MRDFFIKWLGIDKINNDLLLLLNKKYNVYRKNVELEKRLIQLEKEIEGAFYQLRRFIGSDEMMKADQLNEKLNITIVAYQKMKQEYEDMKKSFEGLNK